MTEHNVESPSLADPWVEGQTIGQALAATRQRFPNRDAVVFPKLGLRWTWQDFDSRVTAAAKALVALGLEKGEHVALWATNVPEWIVLQFATARVGIVLVTVNPAYRPYELQYVLKQSDAAAIFLIEQFKSSNYYEMLAEVCPSLATTRPGEPRGGDFPRLRHAITLSDVPLAGASSWTDVLGGGTSVSDEQLARRVQDPQPHDCINIQYTSGTTGFPKAAMLSHRNLLLNAFYVGQCQQFSERDRVCIPVPFYHCFGCVLGTMCCAVFGAAMIIPAEYFHAADTLHAIEQEGATAIYGVPTMFIAELEHASFPGRKLASLRTGIMAGAPCPIEIMRKVMRQMGAGELTIAYGQTEASPVVTQTRTSDPIELRVETVGRPLPGVEVKVVEAATGKTLADNQQGELCCRGHVVMLGYYNNPEATAAAIDADGWLHTGDLAIRLPNGYYKITGRIKDMVIRGGENIYPREIEELLFTHPAVEQSAVVGVPDAKYGEELCAWVKLKPNASLSEEEVREFCRSKLARYKVPRYVCIVDAFPQTVTGKIQKFRIREEMARQLGLRPQATA